MMAKRYIFLLAGLLMMSAAIYAGELKVLCTTFPLFQITRNVAQGRENADLQLLLPASLGCPHNYALTPQDMQKLGGARVLIVNGLGLEEFLGAPVHKANANLVVVDSSSGIKELLQYQDDDHDAKHEAHEVDKDRHASGEKEHEHHHSGTNPHLFASPRMAAQLAGAIAAGLVKVDPDGAELYRKNAAAYAERMNRLAREFAALGKTLKNNRIVTQSP